MARPGLIVQPPDPDLSPVDLAFADGAIAYLEGIPAHWNPARRPTAEGFAWSRGWHAAQIDRLLDVDRRRRALKASRAADVLALMPWWCNGGVAAPLWQSRHSSANLLL